MLHPTSVASRQTLFKFERTQPAVLAQHFAEGATKDPCCCSRGAFPLKQGKHSLAARRQKDSEERNRFLFPHRFILSKKSIIHDLRITFIIKNQDQFIIDQVPTRSVSLLLETVVIRWSAQAFAKPDLHHLAAHSGGYSQSRTHEARCRSCSLSSNQPTTSKFCFDSDHNNTQSLTLCLSNQNLASRQRDHPRLMH